MKISDIKVEVNIEYIQELMEKEGLTQFKLAPLLGVSQPHLSDVLRKKWIPKASTVYKIAMYFDVPMEDLLKEI